MLQSKHQRQSAGLTLFAWVLLAVACAAQVATVNAKTGHLKIQENGVDIIPTGAGTSSNPWVFATASGGVTGSGTDHRIVRWDGTSALQDSLWSLTDTGELLSQAGTGLLPLFAIESSTADPIDWLQMRFRNDPASEAFIIDPGRLTGLGSDLTWLPDGIGTSGFLRATVGGSEVRLVADEIQLSDLPAGIPPGGSAGGVLTGSYPNPGLANGAVAYANLGTATNPGLEDSSGIRVKVISPLTLGAAGVGIQDASTSQKGAAQYSSTFFSVSSGTVSITNNAIGNAQLATSLAPLFATTTQTNTNYTVTATDHLIRVSTGNSTRTITLPLAANNIGRRIVIMKVDTGTGSITVARTSSDVINVRGNWGATSQTITNVQGAGAEFIADASGSWLVLKTI